MAAPLESLGRSILDELKIVNSIQKESRDRLIQHPLSSCGIEELQCWFVCVVALSAAIAGNYGVGAALFDAKGRLLFYRGNEVFHPQFRSDAHAEMQVINLYEENVRSQIDLRTCTLITSLESCPMCLARLITAQVGTVIHIANDDIGGMTRKRGLLPSAWQALQAHQSFRNANCSPELETIALELFLMNAATLNTSLMLPR